MVVVWVSIRARVHKRAETISAIDELAERMQRSAGCARNRLYADRQDPHTLTLRSEWNTVTEAQTFFDSRDFQAFRGIRMLLRDEPLVVFDEVQARVTRLVR